MLNAALGGGTSSRLFQEVREKRGLAYSVYSFTANYADAGYLGVSAGCTPGRIDDVLTYAANSWRRSPSTGITAAESAEVRASCAAGLVLGLEDTGSRMSRIAKAELVYGELPSLADILERVDAVTEEDVRSLAASLLTTAPALAIVGPFDDAARFADFAA